MSTLRTRDSSLEDASVDFIQHVIISGAVESGFWGASNSSKYCVLQVLKFPTLPRTEGMYFILMMVSTYALMCVHCFHEELLHTTAYFGLIMCRSSQEGLSGSRARQMLLLCTIVMFCAATVTMFIDVATSVLEILFYDLSAVYPDALLIRWDMVTNVMVRLVVRSPFLSFNTALVR